MTCEIISEIGNAHNGNYDRAIRLLDAIEASGADAVKFQAYSPAELILLRGDGPAPDPWGSQGWTMRALYEKARTPFDWFSDLVAHCDSVGLPWFASVFGADSLALMESLGCPRYKLAALDYDQQALRQMVEATGKPVIRSSPYLKPCFGTSLWCPPQYPQTHICLRDGLRVHDGFSYHGTDERIPLAAVALGASMVEVHVQLDDEPSELEAAVCLTITQLAAFVDGARAIERAL